MEAAQVSSSQLADACGISRPTVSQILNGRNKKISDELIGKIHDTYPELSVLWLMFGEGNMYVNSNNQFSGAQNTIKNADNLTQPSNSQKDNSNEEIFFGIRNFSSENSLDAGNEKKSLLSIQESHNSPDALKEMIKSVSEKSYKTITNIVVFYADNTFQTFAPTIG